MGMPTRAGLPTARGAALPPGGDAAGRPLRVLVADDDDDIRDLIVFKLTQAGFEVHACADGLVALDAIRDLRPALVVLDVMMPGMSGIDVTRAVRRDILLDHVRIILLTARAQEADVQTGFTVGADDYVIKPFSPRELVSRVGAVLARTRT